ncbi:MAG: hypothetical protein ABFD94_04940 [Armatimonadia bacterium]
MSTLSISRCPRCGRDTLHDTRGSYTTCQGCGMTMSQGRLVTLGDPEERLRDTYRLPEPVDEVAP